MNFMNLPDEYADENSQIVLIPVAYEKDITYGRGASRGPDEIIAASKHLEYYDDELNAEPFEKGIRLLPVLRCSNLIPEDAQDMIYESAEKFNDKFIIGLGGDHSITSAFVKAIAEKHKQISVLILDAHADLRYSWKNSKWNHACVGRRLSAKHPVGLLGVRSMDSSEKEFADKEANVKLVRASELNDEKVTEVLAHLTDTVYISIDADVFDTSFIRNTGTPEPGGLGWHDVLKILKRVFKEKNVVGCDVVEFAPNFNFDSEAYALAKLVYKLAGYKFFTTSHS